MTEKVSKFIESCRTRARAIKKRHEDLGSPVTLAQAYELLAAADGYRTWAAMKAIAGHAGDEDARSFYEPQCGSASSFAMTRKISLDAHDAVEEFDVPALIKAAHADLSYIFFDGEEYPAMRFKGAHQSGDDEYTVHVEMETSPIKDRSWHAARLQHAENIVRTFGIAREDAERLGVNAVFKGSGNRNSDRISWLTDDAMQARSV